MPTACWTCKSPDVPRLIDKIGEKVLIIGVGNTAMDCCRTSLRLGAKDVKVMARKPRGFFKASDWELEETEEEMIELDRIESVPQGLYRRDTMLVLGEDGKWHEADLYRISNPKGPFTPAKSYVELMLSGARQHKLAPEHIKVIEAIYARSE